MLNPLKVILSMSGVVKFKNPLYNPQVIEDIKRQIAALVYHGSFIIEYRGGRVSNVSYSSNSESEIMDMARAFFFNNPDVLCVRVPRFNVVFH